jgi:hypothetical protein
MHSTLILGDGGVGGPKSDIDRFCGIVRCFFAPDDVWLDTEGAAVDSAIEGFFTFTSGVLRLRTWASRGAGDFEGVALGSATDAAFPFTSVVLLLRTAAALVVLGRNKASNNPGGCCRRLVLDAFERVLPVSETLVVDPPLMRPSLFCSCARS